jgi:hypothetical protein
MDLLIASTIFGVVIIAMIVLASGGSGRRRGKATAELLRQVTRTPEDWSYPASVDGEGLR